MSDWRYDRSNRHDVVTIPLVWVAFVLSLLVHIAALWILLPKLMHNVSELSADIGKASGALAVQLEPKPAAVPSPLSAPSPPPVVARASPPREQPRPVPKPKPAPPLIALPKPEAEVELPRPSPPAEAPAVAPKPIEGDLASYIEARRRARGESPSSPAQPNATATGAGETDAERRNRIIAANLGLNKTPSFGYDPKSAGGIFQIEHLSYEYADFYFFGLNKEIGRNTKQLIEVKRGTENDIKIAVIRKMIAIIRDNVSGDFIWLSRRGPVTMSTRASDNAELEAFIMGDVFPDERSPH
jgi:hypothetical protein